MANRYPAFLTRIQQSPVIRQLEQQPAEWMLVTGVVLGAGLGTMALFGIGV